MTRRHLVWIYRSHSSARLWNGGCRCGRTAQDQSRAAVQAALADCRRQAVAGDDKTQKGM